MEVIVATFGNGTSCTSILNLFTYEWDLVDAKNTNIPVGGHLVTSIDESRVFYLGGTYNGSPSLNVYKLFQTGWSMTKAKLPFDIVSNKVMTYPSLHNVRLK